jgi:uncharacterized protein (DUF2384 family)
MATEKIVTGKSAEKSSLRVKPVAAAVAHPAPAKAAKPATTAVSNNAFHGDVAGIIKTMRSGKVTGGIIPDLAKRIGVEPDYLFEQLRLPKRTMARRIALDEPLSSVEQDRIYRVEKVLSRTQQVLEDATAVKTWFNHVNRSLGASHRSHYSIQKPATSWCLIRFAG